MEFIDILFVILFGTVISGPLLRTKISPYGLLMATVAWPTSYLTLVGCLFASIGAGLQCLTG